SRSQSSSVSGTPTRPTIARRWMTAFVEPPSAALTRIAFSNAALVRTVEIRTSPRTRSTIRRPASCASASRRESTAGVAAFCGSPRPSPSTIDAVDRIRPDRLFSVHADQIAVQHGGRTDVGFAGGGDGELERQTACLPDAALDALGERPQMRVARRQLRPGVADADDRPSVEEV